MNAWCFICGVYFSNGGKKQCINHALILSFNLSTQKKKESYKFVSKTDKYLLCLNNLWKSTDWAVEKLPIEFF